MGAFSCDMSKTQTDAKGKGGNGDVALGEATGTNHLQPGKTILPNIIMGIQTKKLTDSLSYPLLDLMIPERNRTGFCIHGIHDGKRFQVVAQIPNDTATDLEALLHHDAASFDGGTGGLDNGDQSLQSTAVGQKIIDDQNMLTLV